MDQQLNMYLGSWTGSLRLARNARSLLCAVKGSNSIVLKEDLFRTDRVESTLTNNLMLCGLYNYKFKCKL